MTMKKKTQVWEGSVMKISMPIKKGPFMKLALKGKIVTGRWNGLNTSPRTRKAAIKSAKQYSLVINKV